MAEKIRSQLDHNVLTLLCLLLLYGCLQITQISGKSEEVPIRTVSEYNLNAQKMFTTTVRYITIGHT